MTAPADDFRIFAPQWTAPFEHAFAVAKSDSANLAYTTRALYVGTTGSVVADLKGGETNVVFAGVPAGTFLPIRAIKIKASSTANSIVGLY